MNWAPELTNEMMQFMSTKDVARWRQTARACLQDTEIFLRLHDMKWQSFISYTYVTLKCQCCPAIRTFTKVEWCPFCESNVCVEHLERCSECDIICCSKCVACDCR
jgi:hypothetical protein